MQTLKTLGLAAALTGLAASGAFAQTSTQTVTFTAAPANFPGDASGDSAQVSASGADPDQTYLDVQGAGNGTFASFGVIDFLSNTVAAPNGTTETVTSVGSSITLDLTDQAYSYTQPGNLNFYLADGTAPLSSLAYNAQDTSATAGVSSQLGNLFSLGRGIYSSTPRTPAGGDLPFTLNLSAAAQSLFIQQLNKNGGDLRFVITADPSTPNEVASFAGAGGGSGGGYPALTFDATGTAPVPEASTTVSLGLLLALGLCGLGIARRRKPGSV